MRKPYWINRLKCWYVKDSRGRHVRLDPDKDVAFDLWHEMIALARFQGDQATVTGLLDNFIDEIEPTLSRARYAALVRYASLFASDYGKQLVSSITPAMVLRWLDSEKALGEEKKVLWSNSSKRHAAALLKRAWKWAHNQGHIRVNTLHSLKLPEPEYRDRGIDFATHQRLVEHCRENMQARPFALYLIASRCGARPQQIRDVTAANVIKVGTQLVWAFKKHKTQKKTGKPLVVYISPCLQTLTRILMASRRTGTLFRNSNGDPWKKDTVAQRMERLRARLKLPEGTVVYLYRHAMATDALRAGLSTAVVAQLLGHTDTRMVSKVYGHLDQHAMHLIESAAKAAKHQLPGT